MRTSTGLSSCPSGKKRFLSKHDAKLFARRIRSNGWKKARAYHCPECGLWHLTTTDAASRAFHRRGERIVMEGT